MNRWIIVSNGRVSEEKYYISSSLVVIIVHGQQSPRSWSTITIGCHSPETLSTAAIRIHHQLPPRSWFTTTIRCQHDTGSTIVIIQDGTRDKKETLHVGQRPRWRNLSSTLWDVVFCFWHFHQFPGKYFIDRWKTKNCFISNTVINECQQVGAGWWKIRELLGLGRIYVF